MPDMMIVQMTDTKQPTYLPHDKDTAAATRLPNLQPTMPSGKAKESYDRGGRVLQQCLIFGKAKEKGQQHAKLKEALRLYMDTTSPPCLTSVAPQDRNTTAATTP